MMVKKVPMKRRRSSNNNTRNRNRMHSSHRHLLSQTDCLMTPFFETQLASRTSSSAWQQGWEKENEVLPSFSVQSSSFWGWVWVCRRSTALSHKSLVKAAYDWKQNWWLFQWMPDVYIANRDKETAQCPLATWRLARACRKWGHEICFKSRLKIFKRF